MQDDDVLIYKENDKEFNINLYRSKTKKYAYIDIDSTNSNEIKLIDLDDPINDPITFITRSDNHLYYLEHIKNEEFIVRSNKNAPNFKILKSKTIGDDIDNFESINEHNDYIYISDKLLVNE